MTGKIRGNSQAKRDAMLGAARALLVQFGHKKVTMEDIAKRCDLERASLYYYFKNREEIFSEVFRLEADRQAALMFEAQNREQTASAKLLAFVRGHFEALATSELAAVAEREEVNPTRVLARVADILQRRGTNTLQIVKNIIACGVSSGEFREVDAAALTECIQIMFLGHAANVLLHQAGADFETPVAAAFELMIRGLQTKPQESDGRAARSSWRTTR